MISFKEVSSIILFPPVLLCCIILYMMTVKALHIKPVKKGETKSVEKLKLRKDFGPEGDAYGGPGERQITLLGEDDLKGLEIDREKGLCIKRFTANIILEGSAAQLKTGEIYKLGHATIRITGEKKVCHKGCVIVEKERRICLLPRNARFAAVETGGQVETGDWLQ